MSQPRNMTTSPWDAQEFSQHGCLAQLVGGPANGEVTQFYKGKRELEVLVNDTKPILNATPEATPAQKLFGKQPRRETYRLEFFEFGDMQFAIGLWSKLPMLDAMLQLLADARALREQGKRPKQTAQSISIEADLIDPQCIKTLNEMLFGKAPKQDTADPKEDTADGTYSTSA